MEARGGKRRVWPAEERQRIVAEATAPNASVAAVALQHGVNANLLFKWIRHARQGWLGRRGSGVTAERAVTGPAPVFVPVEIVDPPAPAPSLLPAPRNKADRPAARMPRRRGPGRRPGAMEISLPNGARVSLDSDVDPAMVRLILSTLVDL